MRYRLILLMSLIGLLTGCSDTKAEVTVKLGPLALIIDHTGEVNIRVGQDWTLPTPIGSLSLGVNYEPERAKYRGLLILRSSTEELAWGLHDENDFYVEGVANTYEFRGIRREGGDIIVTIQPIGNAPSLRHGSQTIEGETGESGSQNNRTPLNMVSCPDLPNLTAELYATVSASHTIKVYAESNSMSKDIDTLSNGIAVCLRGRSADSRWYMLSMGRWVRAEDIYLKDIQNLASLPVF